MHGCWVLVFQLRTIPLNLELASKEITRAVMCLYYICFCSPPNTAPCSAVTGEVKLSDSSASVGHSSYYKFPMGKLGISRESFNRTRLISLINIVYQTYFWEINYFLAPFRKEGIALIRALLFCMEIVFS